MTPQKAKELVQDIKDATEVGKDRGGVELSQWEQEFVDSIEDRLDKNRPLTEAQEEKLEQIWDKV